MVQLVLLGWLLSVVVFGGFCAYVASEKNRSAVAWGILGALFGLIALIAIAGLPSAYRTTPTRRDE